MNIYGLTFAQLEQYLEKIGEKSSKAPLIYKSLYQQAIVNLLDIPVIRASLKERLAADFELELPRIIEQQGTSDTVKFLFALADGSLVEAVLMRQKYGNSVCISSQVGCNMGCAFCQSGRFKKTRDLTAGEMTAQLMAIQQALSLKISNVVLMGIGEPFDNYEQVMAFIDIINHPKGLGIGLRHISVSTCGIVPRIYDYLQRPTASLLAVSLHAPNDQLRSQLMPINRAYPLDSLMMAIRAYISATGKKVMLEYCLLCGINDRPEHALQLAELIGESNMHVNLIPYNETQNLGFAKSTVEDIQAFYDILKQQRITVTMRREFGSSVQAACGQLRANYQDHSSD